ncbi:hypothetical protein SK571_04020 [Lentzea sp. BCCO 10_0798]|uniref:Uncharacterized protein n=1 Tax=Lentzea kristufekii TaxID=3095430 RepID=A0ABU4TJU3_9PSEU|nr:hypothetical protein [Lentzea sp. BCCO 10_0798]MDX8048536.1 hypothetical protein [Lentzea sp. BCCO 10_0798]
MRVGRWWPLLGTIALLAVTTPGFPSGASDAVPLSVHFDQTLHGDFALVGNAVLTCPARQTPDARYPAERCADAQRRKGGGVAALNNGHHMVWADVDDDNTTYNSSTARLALPPGARVAYAELGWAGTTGALPDASCGRGDTSPPGSPLTQAVAFTVNGGPTRRIGPDGFTVTVDDPGTLSRTDQQFYSAHADVTTDLAGADGDVAVTVGDVWTPQGFDCFGGWSLTVVWQFTSPDPRFAPARKHVLVYGGHVRLFTREARTVALAGSMRAAGGPARVGVTAYEGDWANSGDQLLVNGEAQAGDNFFSSFADGGLDPNVPNNMSVDVKTVEVSGEVVKAGDTSAQFAFTGGGDAYLVQGLSVSLPRPALAITTNTDRPAAHVGDAVVQTAEVTNVGGAPASDIAVRIGSAPACAQRIAMLAGGTSATVTCAGTAPEDDYSATATATGKSLVGDDLTAEATATVDVLRPAVRISQSAAPTTVLQGQTVAFRLEVGNIGDTTLSGLAVQTESAPACRRADLGPLDPAGVATVDCSVVAGDEGFVNTVTITGTDRLGLAVSASAQAAFTVVHPRLSITAVWSADRVATGSAVTVTVTVSNPSAVRLDGVTVSGEPASCGHELGTLDPYQTVSYTCLVTIESDVDSELIVTGGGATASAPVRVGLLSSAAPQPEAPPEQIARKAESAPLSKPAVGAVVVTLAVVGMFLVIGATTAATKP